MVSGGAGALVARSSGSASWPTARRLGDWVVDENSETSRREDHPLLFVLCVGEDEATARQGCPGHGAEHFLLLELSHTHTRTAPARAHGAPVSALFL